MTSCALGIGTARKAVDSFRDFDSSGDQGTRSGLTMYFFSIRATSVENSFYQGHQTILSSHRASCHIQPAQRIELFQLQVSNPLQQPCRSPGAYSLTRFSIGKLRSIQWITRAEAVSRRLLSQPDLLSIHSYTASPLPISLSPTPCRLPPQPYSTIQIWPSSSE